jgi:hypothetical protein
LRAADASIGKTRNGRVAAVTIAKSWVCPGCSNTVATPYCPTCGERPLRPRELTLRGLVDQVFQSLSSIDGRVIRTLRCLVNRPGALTVAWVQGQRKPYIAPFQLFLVANLLFFAAQSMTSTNILSTPLDSHLRNQDWSALAQALVAHRLEMMQTTLELYAPVFNQAVALNAKSLIILMVLPLAVLLPGVFYRSRRPFVTHVVFSLHFYAFLLLLFCVALAVAAVDALRGGAGLASPAMDNALSVINLAVSAWYLYAATGSVYGARGVLRALKAAGLTLAAAGIFLGYRYALFLITLYTTP